MKVFPLAGCLLVAVSIDCFTNRSVAQITPDRTLGSESSEFKNNQISGGARRGDNLFHSFKEFNVGKERVDFANDLSVVNIITRVTDVRSHINGILGVMGGANFFLINPHGISFGGGAKLEMSGTFVGSTASGLRFTDGTIFDAKTTGTPLLTMSIPIGLQFGQNPASIMLKNSGNLTLTNPGNPERSYNGSSFLLVGGNIELDNSRVFLRGGKIELVAIGSEGTANIDYSKLTNRQELSLTIHDKQIIADISLKNGSNLITTGAASGGIILKAENIEICGVFCDVKDVKKDATKKDVDSTISRIEAESTKSDIFGKSGSIRLTANSEILIDGKSDDGKKISSGISTSLQDGSKANGGDIIISAKNLRILNGGSLNNMSGKDSSGIGGDINLDITNILELSASRNGKESEIGSNAGGIGKSGNNITIHTNQLIHKDGAQLYRTHLGSIFRI
jgi:filamentous hemagglutinin family protein